MADMLHKGPGTALRSIKRAGPERLACGIFGSCKMPLRSGGLGCYPISDFVHVDVGRVRTW